ncbi:MAG: ribose 5-phosphate isomerase B [Armatimonadetes bacterium]|nr:ribose 5-phosphate isomerase B [Armatimonadota bacterium]
MSDNKCPLKIAIGSDHAGFALKQELAGALREDGYDITDLGTHSTDSVDYPDIAVNVASAVSKGEFDKAILICGTGIGITIAANKIKGIRAAATSDVYSAKMARMHNDANIIGMGARVVGLGLAQEIAKAFLDTDFEAGSRHEKRVNKINALD